MDITLKIKIMERWQRTFICLLVGCKRPPVAVKMEQVVKSISPNELLGEVTALKKSGYRMVAISCTSKDGMEISYSFDKDYDFLNLRLNISCDDEIESISLIYPFAFLYENEIKELFGVNIKNISLDFDGHLYKTAIPTPFKTQDASKQEN